MSSVGAVRAYRVHNCDQRSPEWAALRLGKVTGSRAGDMLAKTAKGEWRAERKNLRMLLVLERITGQSQERDVYGKAVSDGIAREPYALFHYECQTGTVLKRCGFVADSELPIGCSPDGYLGNFEGLVSVKCPLAATHLATLDCRRWQTAEPVDLADAAARGGARATGAMEPSLCIPEAYINQIRHELFVTGAQWCDYVSFHDGFPPSLRALVIRVSRDDKAVELDRYEHELRTFLSEVDTEYQRVMEMAS